MIPRLSTRGILHDPAISIIFFAFQMFELCSARFNLVCRIRHQSLYTPHLTGLKTISSDSDTRFHKDALIAVELRKPRTYHSESCFQTFLCEDLGILVCVWVL